MKARFTLYISLLTLMLSSCGEGETKQKQHDIFPLPCRAKTGNWAYRTYYVDKEGKEIESLSKSLGELDPSNNFAPTFFQDGLINVDVRTPDGYNRLFLDDKGTTIVDMMKVMSGLGVGNPELANYTDFSHGICFIETVNGNDLTYIAINKKGEKVFALDYRPMSAFNDKGQAFCKNDSGHLGIFSETGDILVPPSEDIVSTGESTSGYASEIRPPVADAVLRQDNSGQYTLYDYSGNALSKPMAYRFIPDANDCCVVPAAGAGNTYGIVNRNGEMLCVTDFRNLVNDGKWYWFENSDKEYGWIDMNGDIKIGPLKLDESQSRHSRIDGYPHPFYGAEYSVGTETLVDERHEYYYFGGCMSVSALKKMTEKDGIYNLDGLAGDKASELGVVMVSPVVNGLAIGLSMYAGKAYVYKVSGKKLVKVNGEYGFTPAFGNDYIRLYAAYALNPGALWRGLR